MKIDENSALIYKFRIYTCANIIDKLERIEGNRRLKPTVAYDMVYEHASLVEVYDLDGTMVLSCGKIAELME